MDFQSYFRQEINTTKEFDIIEEDDDDDVFYDELRRQVMQLTSEEDDGEEADKNKVANTVQAGRKQAPFMSPINNIRQLRSCNYYNWPGNKEDCAVAPAWILNLWRSGNGTGVFIPQNVQSRRRNRSRRKKNERGRTYRPMQETTN